MISIAEPLKTDIDATGYTLNSDIQKSLKKDTEAIDPVIRVKGGKN